MSVLLFPSIFEKDFLLLWKRFYFWSLELDIGNLEIKIWNFGDLRFGIWNLEILKILKFKILRLRLGLWNLKFWKIETWNFGNLWFEILNMKSFLMVLWKIIFFLLWKRFDFWSLELDTGNFEIKIWNFGDLRFRIWNLEILKF